METINLWVEWGMDLIAYALVLGYVIKCFIKSLNGIEVIFWAGAFTGWAGHTIISLSERFPHG